MNEKIIELQANREAFIGLLSRCVSVGNYKTTRLDDIDRVKKLSPENRVVYMPNGLVGDVAIVTADHDDLQYVLYVLTSNEVKYAVFYLGNFEAGSMPNSKGKL